MRTRKTPGKLLLSRRSLLRAVGGAAIAGLPGCNGGSDTPSSSPSPPTSPPPVQPAVFIADGYADQQSYRPGDSVTLFLNANSNRGWVSHLPLHDYTGTPVFNITANLFTQNINSVDPAETGFGYQGNASFTLPTNLPSGVYLVDGFIPVIVKTAPATPVDIVIVYPTNTSAAYNTAGGRSLYTEPDPATRVSFLRPPERVQLSFFDEFLAWIAGLDLPYRIRYVADMDLDDYNEIGDAKLLLVIGHSEYWTRTARENFDRFVLGGGNALMLSGNNMWWQVRYSDDRTQMICYKLVPDPIADPLLHTINWPDPSLKYSVLQSLGADFPHGGYGEGYVTQGWKGFRVVLPNSPVFRGVSIKHGDVISLPTIEYDGAPLLNDPLITGGDPKIDLAAIGAYRAEIIGYDYGFRNGADRIGTWIAMQRTATSGVVINGASTNWCYQGVGGIDRVIGRQVILNMISLMVNKQSVFTS